MKEFKNKLHYSLKYYGMIQKKKGKLYPFDIEYIQKVRKILEKGGILWLIERTDTKEFLIEEEINVASGCFSSEPSTENVWIKQIPTEVRKMLFQYTTAHYYLTKKDAEHTLKYTGLFTEGGCRHCGHNSRDIPTVITEHEFVSSSK